MAIVATLLSGFGILFVVRTLHVFRARALADPRALGLIGFFGLACFSLILFFGPASIAARAPLACVITLAMPLCLLTLERRRVATLKARAPLFIDQWILNMRLGASVIAARERALAGEHADVRALLRPVFDATAATRPAHVFLSPSVVRELAQIASASHGALERLEGLRVHVRAAAEFRRKSGLAVHQAVIQAAVMLIMLAALSVFTIRRYGWRESGGFVTAAAALSSAGALVMAHLARKSKWTL